MSPTLSLKMNQCTGAPTCIDVKACLLLGFLQVLCSHHNKIRFLRSFLVPGVFIGHSIHTSAGDFCSIYVHPMSACVEGLNHVSEAHLVK